MKRTAVARAAGISTAALLISLPAAASALPKGPPSPLTNPTAIEELAADAYVWGVAPEFVYRFLKYNALRTAPVNMLGGKGTQAAAWNNLATNAGDASVLYLNSMLDLSGRKYPSSQNGGTKELVLTVPPSAQNYYVANVLDSFINSTGSIGTRTTPSRTRQTYLLVGPTSPYAKKRTARIGGKTFRVMAQDTAMGWMLIRIRADSLVDPSNPASVNSIDQSVLKRFALNTLAQYQRNGYRPIYPKTTSYPPSNQQIQRSEKWANAPVQATAFMAQLGQSLAQSPMPSRTTGIGNTPLRLLPAWVVPQANAKKLYQNPSFGQERQLRLLKPLGLTAQGWKLPRNWGTDQLNALQAGYQKGDAGITDLSTAVGATPTSNYWSFLNNNIGTYPNNLLGYAFRAVIVQEGGSANVPPDAVYAQINQTAGTTATQMVGDNTYSMTFTPPPAPGGALPSNGSIPPTVNDSSGNPKGFWSVHVYQTDPTQSKAPYITQASVLNLAYSQANQAVVSANASADTITVSMPTWGGAPIASTPIFFGTGASAYGFTANTPYYVATTPTVSGSGSTATYTFKVSANWQQELSSGNVPIQGPTGTPTNMVDVQAGSGALQWGPIQPVSQLGSQQITSGQLKKNADGSVTLWIGPTLPAGAPATNWLPSPSQAYYQQVYGKAGMPVNIRPLLRIYYPTPGSNTTPSILPPPNGSMQSTWVPPAVTKVG